jgi:exonuclease VII small subunit
MPLARKQHFYYTTAMTQDDLLQKIGEMIKPLQEGQERIEAEQKRQGERLGRLEQGQNQLNDTVSHIKTAVEAIAEGQKSLATKADMQRIILKDKEQDKRLTTLEEEKGISHKN